MLNNLLTPEHIGMGILWLAMFSVLTLVICTVTMFESLITRVHNRKLRAKLRLIQATPVYVKGIVIKNEIEEEDLMTNLHRFLRNGYEHWYDTHHEPSWYTRRYLVYRNNTWIVGSAEFQGRDLIEFRIEKGLSEDDRQYILALTGEQDDQ